MIVETVFLSIWNQIMFYLAQNRKVNCHHDHIPFNLKGNIILVFSVCVHCANMAEGGFIRYPVAAMIYSLHYYEELN